MEIAINIFYWLYTLTYASVALVIIVSIINENRTPVKSLAWILLMLLLPVVGIIIYLFVGHNFRLNKSFAHQPPLRMADEAKPRHAISADHLHETDIPPRMQKVVRLLQKNSNAPIYPGNHVDIYTSGESTFDALFRDIEQAKSHIHIEFYIIANDEVGNYLRDLLIQKAFEGVQVRVIYDYLGAWSLPPLWRTELRDAGVEIVPFLPANSLFGFFHLNFRNHRKVVVIDGKTGYTGGVNIADRYRIGNHLGHWRDTFIRIEGPAIHDMQRKFLNDWEFASSNIISDERYYPTVQYYDNTLIQTVTSGPDTDWESIMQGIICAIQVAQRSIYVHTPYCIPPDAVLTAMQIAALAGVDVRLMIPRRSDARLVSAAGRSYFETLLKAGVRVFYYQHNFLHSKAIVVDGYLSIIGTANMDTRSYEQNFEIASFIYCPATAEILNHKFEEDMLSSRELNLNVWRSRPAFTRFKESIARLFSPLL